MTGTVLQTHYDALIRRAAPDGSFAVAEGAGSRPDATAWAAMALFAANLAPELVAAARAVLAAAQSPDGRVALLPERPEAAWPTALALLAWLPDPARAENVSRAAAWLMAHPGSHWPKNAEEQAVIGHDTSLRGWNWIDGTHSWVEPTALAMLALGAMAAPPAEALAEAARLLLDRQLPDGGWNYGNTRVFKNTLLPVPESTGHALAALAGRAATGDVAPSLAYLQGPQCAVPTPLAAAWRAFGLGGWGLAGENEAALCLAALERQSRYGPYDTPQLAQCLAAAVSRGRFATLIGGSS